MTAEPNEPQDDSIGKEPPSTEREVDVKHGSPSFGACVMLLMGGIVGIYFIFVAMAEQGGGATRSARLESEARQREIQMAIEHARTEALDSADSPNSRTAQR